MREGGREGGKEGMREGGREGGGRRKRRYIKCMLELECTVHVCTLFQHTCIYYVPDKFLLHQIKILYDNARKKCDNARKKCEYFNSANCACCFPLALFWCTLIRLSHMRVCLALDVVAQIKIAHDMQISNFVQIAQYYSCIFF